MMFNPWRKSIPIMVFSIMLISLSVNFANAESVPDWVKNTALWYGEGMISEKIQHYGMVKE